MAYITDHHGNERHVLLRRVPGYYNGSTYTVTVDGKYLGDVRRVSDGSWNRYPLWRGYRPGVDWLHIGPGANEARRRLLVASGHTRGAVVLELIMVTEADV